MTKLPVLPASALMSLTDDMRRELIEDIETALEELRMDLAILQQEIALGEEQLKRVTGAPAPSDYDTAFAKLDAGGDTTAVREEFQGAFPDISDEAFRQAMYRRRLRNKQEEARNDS